MPARFYRMREKDLVAVLRLWRRTEGVGLNESDTPAGLRKYLRRNPGVSIVARDAGALVGAVLGGHDGRRGYLHHLAVAKSHRKQGLGKTLVAMCLARLAEIGILKCNIFLYANNEDGEGFWKHNGWANRDDLCVMQKAIHPATTSQRRSR